jgi:hypothetical protein
MTVASGLRTVVVPLEVVVPMEIVALSARRIAFIRSAPCSG